MELGYTEAPAAEDPCGVNGGGDDLFVDELFDFSNGFTETEDPPENRSIGSVHDVPPPPPDNFSISDFGSLHESELCYQEESLESLEWLSHFVEDSFPDYSLAGKLPPGGPAENRSQATAPEPIQRRFATPVQTKRPRAGVAVLSPSSSTAAPPKKLKRKSAEGGEALTPRRCAHCGVTKTPQWRTGPSGPKTLCNACGVRHNSGRLLPEYRPACSPTFSTEMHSNNHRKVLEMRRKKVTSDSE